MLSCVHLSGAVVGFQYVDGKCLYVLSDLTAGAVTAWCLVFVVPSSSLVGCYACVIHALRKRWHLGISHSSISAQATKLLTKSAIAASIVFVMTYGTIGNIYLVGILVVIPPETFYILYHMSNGLTALNSAINPFIYSFFLPAFRRGVLQVFHTCNCGRKIQGYSDPHTYTQQPNDGVITADTDAIEFAEINE